MTCQDIVSETVLVPIKYHDFNQHSSFFRASRSFVVSPDHSVSPVKYVALTWPSRDEDPSCVDDADDDNASVLRHGEGQSGGGPALCESSLVLQHAGPSH